MLKQRVLCIIQEIWPWNNRCRKYGCYLFCLALLLLTGCTPPPPETTPRRCNNQLKQAHQLALNHIQAWQADGKITYQKAEKKLKTRFTWNSNGKTANIDLLSPFGQTMATLVLMNNKLQLNLPETAPNQTEQHNLIKHYLPANLPVQQLPQWLLGKSATNMRTLYRCSTAAQLNADDWQINWSHYRCIAGYRLPTKIQLQYADQKLTFDLKNIRIKPGADPLCHIVSP